MLKIVLGSPILPKKQRLFYVFLTLIRLVALVPEQKQDYRMNNQL